MVCLQHIRVAVFGPAVGDVFSRIPPREPFEYLTVKASLFILVPSREWTDLTKIGKEIE